MTDEKQSPYTTATVTMSSNFLQTSGGLSGHRNISSPSSSSYIPDTGYPFGDLGIGSHGSPKSTHEDMDTKEDSKLDLYPDVKGLNLAITLPFQDSDHSSTNTPSQFSQILSFRQSSVPAGDAMLSAINYENDILPEALDVNLAGPLPQLDDGILSNMGAPGDLFDGEGNVNDPYSMDDYSPQTSHDFGGFSSDGYGGIDSDHGLSNQADPGQGLEGLKQQKKPKSHKPAKGQTSPARLGSLQCPTCSKTFTNSSALAKHRLTHSDERKYVCNLCQKAFKRQDHLNGHLMTHREKKPYECTVDNCTKSYCDARSLRRHLENHHNQTPEQIHGAIALVASNAAAVIAAAAATNSAQNKAAQVNVSTTANTVPIMASSIVSNESSQGSDIKPLSFSSGNSTPVTSPVYGDQPSFPIDQSPAGSMENQINSKQTATAKLRSLSEEESVGQKVQMLLDQAAAASQTNTDETITLHSAQGNQTVTISADNLPQTIAIESSNVLMKHIQPGRQWQDQNVKVNSVQSAHSSSPRSGEPSPGYLQQVSPISPVPNTQLTPSSPVMQPHPQQRSWNTTVSPANVDKNGEEVKPAECTICERTFKNVQALNGHMRCHGGYFKKEPKEDKKTKKNSKEMAPPKSVAPKGNKLIASMPHPSPLDKVGSPQSGQGSAYGSQLQSPVSGDSPVGIDGSAMVLQQFGLDQLQVGEPFWQQIQIHQQQIQGEQLQQQLQQQLQVLQMEQTNVEVKIQQLKDQLQQQNQQLTQKQEQTMQQELQLQSALQQQIQQLQLQNTQQLKQQEAQNILLGLTQESHNMKQEHHLQDKKMAKPQDTDISILHNLQHPTGTQLLQAFQHNLAAKQEADRQLYDIQAILKQEAENQTNTQQNRKQPISKEDMEKHLIQRLFLQGGNPSAEAAVSLQQQIEQQKASLPPTSQPQHVNSILLEKMKQKQQQERQQQQMLKTIQQPYNPGQLPTLIHHHPQVKEETKLDTASVPTSQVPRPLHLQRQVSFEEMQNQPQHSIELTSPQQITHQQLQQLLQQRNDTLNSQQPPNNLSDSHGMQHMDLSPPPSLTPTSIQSNLQTAIAQIPLFALKTPTEIGSMGQFNQLPQSKIVTTSAESPDLSLILETIDNDQKTSLSSAKTLPQHSQPNQDNLWTTLPKTNHGHLTDARKSTVNYSQIFNEKVHGAEMFFGPKNVPFLDSALHKMGTDPPLHKPEAIKPEKAADQNPFAFPVGNGAQNDFAHPDTIKNPKHHRHKPIANQHTELKRRLSVGSECDLNSSVLPGMINNNNKGYSAKFPSNSAQNILSVKPRMRSKSGDDFKYFRSKSEDHTFMRPRSQTEECLWKYKQKSEDSWDQALSKSDGAGLFRNPNSLTTPLHLRMKRKHRPAPLFIPRHGSLHGGFQSRLRSPRVLTASEHKGNTPPPYTPPPMLSPIRSGSGLFWTIQKPPMTPMTAPITPRTSILSMSRNGSIGSAQPDVSKPELPDDEEPPETDILPHVNIGSQYQAEIPPFNCRKKEALTCVSKEDLVFDHERIKDCSDNEVQYFQEFANSAAVRGNGCNTEYALHLLHLAKGNIQKAMLMLMETSKELPAHHTLLSFTYQENDVWTTEEAEKYLNALLKCDKDFFSVSKEIGSKSVKECIQFYYLWKKVCPDEHKRLRIIRNKRERERLYNLRSQQQQQQPATLPEQPENEMEINDFDEDSSSSTDMEDTTDIMLNNKEDDTSSVKSTKSVKSVVTSSPASVATSPAPMFTCDYPECNASFNSKQALNGHIRVHGGGSKSSSPAREYRPPAARLPKPQGSPASSEDLNGEGFPCKLCGRVFAKVRSRSAHMKSHRMNESDKKPVNKKPVPVPVLDNIMPKMSPNG
ncbi:uncharacterized protein LOC127698551 isoform X3 [Mytilus californianus]|uniref:uncharacterized protein LOC127698551 isoform X3 n=1 Tax=Mytilus californianus TaxID=6549 RepID=UPI00224817C7|nr:uncharacterized protein LOC127698551 isoform X3 [Mytilus californianus]